MIDEYEIAKLAYKLISTIKDMYADKDIRSSIHSRCRSIYGLMFMNGALSAISFIYAKAGQDLVFKVYDALKKQIMGEKAMAPQGKKEDLGYAAYAAFLNICLERAGLAINNASIGRLMEYLLSDMGPVYEKRLLILADWLKRLSETLLRED